MKILKYPEPIVCSCCGTEFQYDETDVYDDYVKYEDDTVHYCFYVDCPSCKKEYLIRDEILEDTVIV